MVVCSKLLPRSCYDSLPHVNLLFLSDHLIDSEIELALEFSVSVASRAGHLIDQNAQNASYVGKAAAGRV